MFRRVGVSVARKSNYLQQLSLFSSTIQRISFLGHSGKIDYLKDISHDFPYYSPYELPTQPEAISDFVFNTQLISPSNPYGLVTEDCNHHVYRAKAPSGEIFYIKDLSRSKMNGLRDEGVAQYLAYQESYANWLMYQIYGPRLIPRVFPVRHKNSWGIASSEIKYFGTLSQLAERLGYSEKEIAYGHASAMKVINGKTVLDLGKGQEPVRIKGRIALKIGLRMVVAHYDAENHRKNVFMVLVPDPLHYRQVACPGIFDLGCVFCPIQMDEMIKAYKDPQLRATLIDDLVNKAVDAHIEELNIEDYELIEDRILTKHLGFKRVSGLPWLNIQKGLIWFQQHTPPEARQHIETINEFLFCSRKIGEAVRDKLAEKSQQEHELQVISSPLALKKG